MRESVSLTVIAFFLTVSMCNGLLGLLPTKQTSRFLCEPSHNTRDNYILSDKTRIAYLYSSESIRYVVSQAMLSTKTRVSH